MDQQKLRYHAHLMRIPRVLFLNEINGTKILHVMFVCIISPVEKVFPEKSFAKKFFFSFAETYFCESWKIKTEKLSKHSDFSNVFCQRRQTELGKSTSFNSWSPLIRELIVCQKTENSLQFPKTYPFSINYSTKIYIYISPLAA